MQAVLAIVSLVTLCLCACGADVETQAELGSDSQELQVQLGSDNGAGPVGTSALPCLLAPYPKVTVNLQNPRESYVRPANCTPGWSGLEVTFHLQAAAPYRKLYAMAGFHYEGQPNSKARCLASRVEFETYGRTPGLNGTWIWLPTKVASYTPIYIDETELCYWHNYNAASLAGASTVVERVRARGVRYDGQIENVSVAGRVQAEQAP